jgi:CDP-diacylglycerol--glycerol-3-phosphate 3-phosphatidyltransferase
VVFGVLGAWIAIDGGLPGWALWVQPLLCLLLAVTVVKRVRGGLGEVAVKV